MIKKYTLILISLMIISGIMTAWIFRIILTPQIRA
jgi:hypothetical protein